MTQPACQSRAQAALPDELVEMMARAAYERSRFIGCTRPPWEQLEPSYQAEARADQRAALLAAVGAGRITINGSAG